MHLHMRIVPPETLPKLVDWHKKLYLHFGSLQCSLLTYNVELITVSYPFRLYSPSLGWSINGFIATAGLSEPISSQSYPGTFNQNYILRSRASFHYSKSLHNLKKRGYRLIESNVLFCVLKSSFLESHLDFCI